LTEKSRGSITSESVDELTAIHQCAKIPPEKNIWELAHESPDVDVAVWILSGIFGPFVDRFLLPATREGLGTINCANSLLTCGSEYAPNSVGHMVDVRDSAKTHFRSLDAPSPNGKNKRLIILLRKSFTWKEAADVLHKNRPELASRFPAKMQVLLLQSCAPFDLLGA
ncbi:hypothetical protein C8J56DRAFT_778650, partial [Mycena floridula]